MSVQAISYVLDHSEAAGSERLVLIALANHACSEKAECWPSVRLLARESRCSERTVQYALKQLEHAGRIERCETAGRNGTVRRRLIFDAATEKDRPSLPKQGADAAPLPSRPRRSKGADPAPGADSAGAQPATPRGADRAPEGVQTSAPEPSRGTVREPSAAADAAAAGASAPGDSTASAAGSSSAPELPLSTPKIWPAVRACLIAGGFPVEHVDKQRPEIARDGRRLKDRLVDVDWTAAGAQLARERASGRCYAETPLAAFRFLANQLGHEHKVAAAQPARPAAATAPVRVPSHIEIPEPTEAARDAWAALREQFETFDDSDRWTSWINAIHPLAVDGATLELTAPPHAASWIEQRLVPTLTEIARRGRADVRWVEPAHLLARGAEAA